MFDMLSIFVMWPTERDCHICPPLASSEKSIVDMNCLVWLSLHSKNKAKQSIKQKNKQNNTPVAVRLCCFTLLFIYFT